MSAAPQLPPYDRRPGLVTTPPRRRRALWKRVALWAGGIVAVLILLIVGAVVFALHSARVHSYVLQLARRKATAALGTNVRLRDFGLHFSGISPVVDLYDIVIAGAPPLSNPPLAEAEQLHVAVTITSLLHRQWYVDDVSLVRPIVHIQVNAQGTSNLPKIQSSGGKSNTNVFDLGVRHARIENGEAYYNDKKAIINADLHALNFSSTYNVQQRSYSGSLSYRDGHIITRDYAPVTHEFEAQFVAAPDKFTLSRAVLRSGNSSVELTASVQNYSNPLIDAQYQATLDSGEFRRILKNPSLPIGIIRTSGNAKYSSADTHPFLSAIQVNGELNSNHLLIQASSIRQPVANLAAQYTLANGNLHASVLRALVMGGDLTAALTTRNLGGNSRSHLNAHLRSISLQSAQSLANSPTVQQLGISGALNANVNAAWGPTLDNLLAHANATINARVNGNRKTNPIPVNGNIDAGYDARRKQIELANSFIRTPQTSLTMNGTVSDRSALQVNLQANDLHELETLAEAIRSNQPPVGLYGQASLTSTITGSTSDPRAVGHLNASNVRLRGSSWTVLRADINARPNQISVQNGTAQLSPRGQIAFALSSGLDRWSFTETSPVQLSLKANQINVADLTRSAGIQTAIGGTLAANISVHGSEQSPAGQGTITLMRAKIEDEPIDSVNLHFTGTGNQLQASLNASLPAGSLAGNVILQPKARTYDAKLQANGIQLDKLQTVAQRNLQLTGALNLNANGKGSFDNPALNASLEIPQLTVKDQNMRGIKLDASIANHIAKFDLGSQLLNTSISGHGTINLTGDYFSEAVLDTKPVPLATVAAMYAPGQAGDISGQTELHATLRGPLKKISDLEAHATIPTLSLQYKNTVHLAETGPIHIDYVNGVLNVPRSGLRGTDTDLQFQGTVPLKSKAPASTLLQGSIDLGLAQIFDPDIASSGQLRFDINSYGKASDPNVQGQIRIVNANFSTPDVPLGLQNGNGVLTLMQDRLQITQFQGQLGGGEIKATGAAVYRPTPRFNLALNGEGIRLLYNNVRGEFNTNLALIGTMDSARVQGQVNVAQLQFTPAFDLMNFMSNLGGGAATPPPTGGLAQATQLDVGVASATGVNLVSRTMSLQANAQMRVVGTVAQPVLLGRINLGGGDLIFRGNRYVLQGGTINFVNPSETQPVVNVSVNTDIQQYNIQMHFWGPADHLHTNYSSDPSLPPSDIINLVALGHTQEYSAANPNPPGSIAAEQAIASQVSSQITNRVEKVAGLSQLSVDPLLGGAAGESPGARVTVQQRVTGKIFVTFSTDLTSTVDEIIKVEYHENNRVSYSATRDQNGGFGFDRRIHKEW